MKKIITIDYKKAVDQLNLFYNDWIKHLNLQNENASGPDEIIPLLKKLKKAGAKIGNIDISTAPDLASLSSRKTDLMKREILSLRELKNTKIELRQYGEAVELDKKEHAARTELNKFICEIVFETRDCFYEIPEDKIGFVYSGNKFVDVLFEKSFTRVFKEFPVFGLQGITKKMASSTLSMELLKKAA